MVKSAVGENDNSRLTLNPSRNLKLLFNQFNDSRIK